MTVAIRTELAGADAVTPFSSSIVLKPAGENLWAGEADPLYGHLGGAGRFGGWTAAMLLRAAMLEPGERGEPLSLTVLFTDAIGDGPIEISTRLLRAGARLQFWRSEISQRGKLCAHAQATFGMRRETLGWTDAVMPDAPPPEGIESFPGLMPVPFLQQFDSRWTTLFPMDPRASAEDPARSVFWLRDVHGRRLDYTLLAAMADYAPPRVAWKKKAMVRSSTVSMTIHFHGTEEELAAVGSDYVLSEVQCRRSEGGYFDHELKLWSRSGVLLATSEQVAAFRD
jgi:acyl-CoA thioesterase